MKNSISQKKRENLNNRMGKKEETISELENNSWGKKAQVYEKLDD